MVCIYIVKYIAYNVDCFDTGSHHNSIRMILSGTVDAAAIDSNVLRQWYLDHPSHQEELHTVTSLGPLPIQPIIFNTRLSGTSNI